MGGMTPSERLDLLVRALKRPVFGTCTYVRREEFSDGLAASRTFGVTACREENEAACVFIVVLASTFCRINIPDVAYARIPFGSR
jgi:hypothetical protein